MAARAAAQANHAMARSMLDSASHYGETSGTITGQLGKINRVQRNAAQHATP